MFTVQITGIEAAISKLQSTNPERIRGGLRRGIMQTLRGAKQDAETKVAARYTIAPSKVTSRIQTKMTGDLSGAMTASGGKFPLKNFVTRPSSRPKIMPAGGTFVMNVRGQGGMIRRGFLKSNRNVYERVGASRFPLRHLKGPSAPGMLSSHPVSSFIVRKMEERIKVNIERQVNRLLG